MTAATAVRTERHYADDIKCPEKDCETTGSLPGIKRHLAKVHAKDWQKVLPEPGRLLPPSREVLSALTTETLREMASRKGVEGYKTMRKDDLVEALAG